MITWHSPSPPIKTSNLRVTGLDPRACHGPHSAHLMEPLRDRRASWGCASRDGLKICRTSWCGSWADRQMRRECRLERNAGYLFEGSGARRRKNLRAPALAPKPKA